tara:strand:- start:202 stop:1125 length:924 start_codon:yes stop_codon:yes gene_type:complete
MNNFCQKILPISCICSIYKGTILEEFIIAIDSLLVQEYIPSEIIVIVDGLIEDEILIFLKNLMKKEKIFKIYFIDQNKGLGLALRYGLLKCNNKIVARFDSDDINLENRLKIQFDLLKENPEISIVGSDVIEFNNSDNEMYIKKMKNYKNITEGFMMRNQLNHPSIMYRKKDILDVGSYRDITYFEDYELWLRCLKKGVGIYNIDKSLVAMRRPKYLSNRIGFKYATYELRFLIETIRNNTIKKIYIPLFIIRIIIRIIPQNFSFFIRFFDSSRSVLKKEFNLNDYILKVTKNKNSLYKKYNKFIKK